MFTWIISIERDEYNKTFKYIRVRISLFFKIVPQLRIKNYQIQF